MVQELIDKAIAKYPVSVHYTGQLSEEDIFTLEEVCDVKCSSVYMSGSATYSIRFRGAANDSKQTQSP